MSIEELIAKLEASKEGSWELDRAIWLLLRIPKGSLYVPRYTTSLDSALQLVPEGMGWGVKLQREGPDRLRSYAWVDGDAAPFGPVAVRYGITPALALCIAALRSRAAAERTKT